MSWPILDPAIEVHSSIEALDPLWDRFEVFEAIHHRQSICNPMQEPELERLVDLLDLGGGLAVVDIACGPGELLVRCHERGVAESIGLDLSPWMLQRAVLSANLRLGEGAAPSFVLADAAKWTAPSRFDRVVCLGADWIWRGMVGTVGALARLVAPGGLIAYGGPRLNFDADRDTVTAEFGRLDSISDVEHQLVVHGLRLIERIDPGEQGWCAYLERGRRDVLAWAEEHPGERADRWRRDQAEWSELFQRDRHVVGWSVWVAQSCS